jgi:hypothetical protein
MIIVLSQGSRATLGGNAIKMPQILAHGPQEPTNLLTVMPTSMNVPAR